MDQIDQSTGLEIAIIGIGGRFPGAKTTEEFWQNLCDGVESISFFSDQEVEHSTLEPEIASHPSHVKAAGVLEDVDQFDAAFFGYTPREAQIMDPQFRVFFECAWEALEQSGYDPETTAATIGVYAGAGGSSYLINNLLSNRDLLQESGGVFQTMLGNTSDQLTMLTSYKLNLKGPSVAVQTSCSTSLVAVHLACQSLLIGDCDMALAGGVSISFPQKSGYLYQDGGIMSPDGHCRAFDADAQGTVNGYGAGVVVLKRLANAVADGDHIYAVIKGSAINNDGSTKAGYTAPSIEGQARVISAAHIISEVDPATISYIEAHGTGTPLGDPIEVAALTEAFRASTSEQGFCAIGSVKTNIGHLDAAAGVTGLIKTALALHHQALPPSLHFTQPNPKIDFANSPFYVNAELTPWTTNGTPRHAGVSSFGIGGTNAHVILEEAPPIASSGSARSAHLLVLSAKTETALATAATNLAAYLEQHPNANLADVGYTLQVGRKAFAYRRMLVCRDVADALNTLQTADPRRTQFQNGGHRPIIFMFPGQGAQYVRMAAEVYAEEPAFREEVDRCCELLKPHLGLDLRDFLYPTNEAQVEATEQLNQTVLTQPALFVIEYALAKLLLRWGVKPHAMIGHSIGEYVAACLAGVFSLEDALALVAVRGQLIQSLPGGSMLVIPLPAAEVQALLRSESSQDLALAASNGLAVSVVSGPPEAVAALREQLAQRGIECRIAHTSHAFHSSMMDPILKPFVEQARKIALHPPQMPYLSNLTGTWITADQATDPEYWARHLRQTVRFIEGIQELASIPEAIFLEVGPGHTLSTLAKQCLMNDAEQRVVQTMRHVRSQVADQAFLLEAIGRLWLRGASIDWAGMYVDGVQERRRVPLPTYPFERQSYWVEPQQQTFTQQRSLTKKADLADWFYVPVWQQSPLPDSAEPAGTPAEAQRWLIFMDQGGLGERLAQQLSQGGANVTTVTAGAEFAQLDAGAYSVNPQQPIDYQALFRALSTNHQSPTLVVHLWSVTSGAQAAATDDYQDQGFFSLLTLAQVLGEHEATTPVKLFIVSDNIQDVTGDEDLIPAKATILGASKVIPQEYATIACRSIDFGAITQGRALDIAVDQLIAECLSPAQDDQVAYRHRHRWTRRFEAVRLQPADHPAALRTNGVYLITGGMSELGLALAEYLFQTAQANVVLVDRSPLPQREQWQFWLETHDANDKVSRVIHGVQALEAAGAEIMLFSADVASRERMASVIAEIQARLGPINGVIHTDSVVGAGIIQLKTPEQAGSVFAPKLTGTCVLESLLAENPLDFMVLFSSTTALTGGFGQADYCAANTFIDAYAHQSSGETRRTAINWGVWEWDDGQDQLMASIPAIQEQFRQIRLTYGMTIAEAIDAFARIMSRNLPQVIVSTQDFQAVMDQSSGLSAMNALEQLEKLRQVEPTHARPDLAVPYVAPRNEVEEVVTTTLGRLLGMQQVGIQDNFFDLGGNSLLAIQLVSALRAQFHVELHMNSLFEAGTVADLATIIEAAQEQQREREELEALLREIEQFSAAEAQERLIVELGHGEEASNNG